MGGPTYRWDKNVWVMGNDEAKLFVCCGGIYDFSVEFVLDMDSSKYRRADIDRAKEIIARYVPAVSAHATTEPESWLKRFLKSKFISEAD